METSVSPTSPTRLIADLVKEALEGKKLTIICFCPATLPLTEVRIDQYLRRVETKSLGGREGLSVFTSDGEDEFIDAVISSSHGVTMISSLKDSEIVLNCLYIPE